jgi:LAS superfamily LD-carboxypeptidase LdcB
MVKYVGHYKAAPGYSNHTQGLAFDITTTEGGTLYTADASQNAAWEKTWLRKWMLANAGRFGFHKLSTEAWHWDWKP